MSKSNRLKIKLLSTLNSGHFYTTTRSKRLGNKIINLMKFDPKLRKHIKYKEVKINY